MSSRETVAAADLRPDDLILPDCHMVVGYAYGMGAYTVVPMIRATTKGSYRNPIVHEWAYSDSEIPVEVIRD